jgi:hypothetical protein
MENTITKIEIIWDRDHGTQNEGWYWRATREDGQERDQPLDGDIDADHDELIADARFEIEAEGYAIAVDATVEVWE